MKNVLFLLSFLFMTGTIVRAQTAASMTFNCTIEGKAFAGNAKTALTVTKKKDYKTPPRVDVSLICTANASTSYSLTFYLPINDATLKVGSYKLGSITASEDDPLPNAYFDIEEKKGKDLTVFGSRSAEDGMVEITSVAGGWIEGTFSLTAHSMFDDVNKRSVTAGKFRFKMQPVR